MGEGIFFGGWGYFFPYAWVVLLPGGAWGPFKENFGRGMVGSIIVLRSKEPDLMLFSLSLWKEVNN